MSLKSKEKQGKNNNEERKTLTKKITLNKLQKISLSIVSSIVLIAFVLTLIFFVRKNNSKSLIKGNTYVDPELARAMTYEQFEPGDENIEGTENVKFSAFFLRDLDGDGYAEKIKGTCKEIGTRDTLYMEINVLTEGRLNNAKIEIDGKNFKFATSLPKDQQIKTNAISNNTKEIEFNDLLNGTQKLLSGIVTFSTINNNVKNYTRNDNKIILTGTYVDENGNETEIRKEIELITDWYGKTRTVFDESYQDYYDLNSRLNENNGTIDFEFVIGTKEEEKELEVLQNHVEVIIPEFNGYKASNVTVTSSNINYNYDEETQILTIDRVATVDDNGNIIMSVSRNNSYNIIIKYPIESYGETERESAELIIPVKGYYDGFNNRNREFINPYRSNIADTVLNVSYFRQKKVPDDEKLPDRYSVSIGNYIATPYNENVISKEKPMNIYQGISTEESDDDYLVSWYYYNGNEGQNEKITLKEDSSDVLKRVDNFLDVSGTYFSMEDVTINKGIYFGNLDTSLEEDGEIKIYDDEQNSLLLVIDKNNINKYISDQFLYDSPVKHIRAEITGMKEKHSIYIYNIKELDDDTITSVYTEEEFKNLKEIRTTLTATKGEILQGTKSQNALYVLPTSIARIELRKSFLSTQETEKNDEIRIIAEYNESYNEVGWSNGIFLVKIPEEIIETKIKEIRTNKPSVSIISNEYFENEYGKFIKIYTSTVRIEDFAIIIDVDLTPDPRIPTLNRELELYAFNEEATDYYYKATDIYDVNNNSNELEMVNKTTCGISLISPNSLLTNQTLSEFDESGVVIVSPNLADVRPQQEGIDNEERTAKIGIQVKNNYSNDISEVAIIGKIPFEGNTSVLAEHDLGSSFTTKMLDRGIELPSNLQESVDVYYSTNENPSRDLNNEQNGWKKAENVEDWGTIKSFLIDFKDTLLSPGQEHMFYYKVAIPNGLNYNMTSYSQHGIWFALNTDEGKYRTKTEPTKIGIRIADKYGLELTKYHTGKEKKVSGATYSISEINGNGEYENTRTLKTNADGLLRLSKLYIDKVYEIKEIKTPMEYELNLDTIRFICHVDDEGILEVEKLGGKIRDEFRVVRDDEENKKITVSVEDEAKVALKIIKTEKDTQNVIPQVKYKITGEGLPATGRVLTTDYNGEAVIAGLNVGTEYNLEETKAEGYYLNEPINFTIFNNNGIYEINVDGEYKATNVTLNNEIPTINLELENEKIPTYNLRINKVQSGSITQENPNGVPISGAGFKLYKERKLIGNYETNNEGQFIINGLNQYDLEKNIDQTYVLKEVQVPEGYTISNDLVFKVSKEQGDTISFIEEVKEGEEERLYSIDGTTVTVTIEENPIFKLIKKDAETNMLLPNTKFAIYNLTEGNVPARDINGELLGTKEIIEDREYYVVTTDENGEIVANLPNGLYKAIEVEATDVKYDITDKIEYFKIGNDTENVKEYEAEWAYNLGNCEISGMNIMEKTLDGGFLIGSCDRSGIISKYNSDGQVEWTKNIGNMGTGANLTIIINSATMTVDGGYILGGYFSGSSLMFESHPIYNSGGKDGLVLKISGTGEIEWINVLQGTKNDQINAVAKTKDGNYLVGGFFQSDTLTIGNETIDKNGKGISSYSDKTDAILVKYSPDGEIIWTKKIGGRNSECINSIAVDENGGFIVGGYFYGDSSSITIDGNVINNTGNSDGIVIKFNSEAELEWFKTFSGVTGVPRTQAEEINSVIATSDGGYMVAGIFHSGAIMVENQRVSNHCQGSGFTSDIIIVKYDSEGNIEWFDTIGNREAEGVSSITESKDGGYFLTGDFTGGSIVIGECVICTEYSTTSSDGMMIIKYNHDGNVEWADTIGGGSRINYIGRVIETGDDSYIISGKFRDLSIDFDGITLTNDDWLNHNNGFIAKYKLVDIPELKAKNAKSITGKDDEELILSVAETKDGGCVAGGYFRSPNIKIGNTNLINHYTGASYDQYNLMDGFVVKYDNSLNVEWAKCIGSSKGDKIYSVIGTEDGGVLAGGYFSDTITIGNDTYTSSGVKDGILIKFNQEGKIEWTNVISDNGSEEIKSVATTKEGGYVIAGNFSSDSLSIDNIELKKHINEDGIYTEDGFIARYNNKGEAIWAKCIGGSKSDYVESLITTEDEGFLIAGLAISSTITVDDKTITSNDRLGGIVLKYDFDGNVEWINNVERTEFSSITEIKNGNYIAGGNFGGTITIGNQTIISADNIADGIIIEFNNLGEAVWGYGVGGSSQDYIRSVTATSDGGFIVGGYSYSICMRLGSRIMNINNNSRIAGIIIKYNANHEIECFNAIDGGKTNEINSITETQNGDYLVGGGHTINGTLGNSELTWDGDENNTGFWEDGLIATFYLQKPINKQENIVFENSRKEFKITTKVKILDKVKGGTISGEDEKPYEIVKYGNNSIKEIRMVPNENYEIVGITINGENYIDYEVNPDGSFTLPQFENMTENKHIVVSYASKDSEITINKVDSITGEKIEQSGTRFKLDQIDERNEPVTEDITGELKENGISYIDSALGEECSDILGNLTSSGSYYFVEQDGKYYPTNSRTYQLEHGGTSGIAGTANSYIPIDLTGLDGTYKIVVNANVSSRSSYDFGFATITQTVTSPAYNNSTGRFIYISGTTSSVTTAQDYESPMVLQGGQKYYLHIGYRKYSTSYAGADQFVVNSVKLYKNNEITYNFVNNNGKYESTNQGQSNTVSNSYIPINLEGYTGKYNLTINAQVSSQYNNDYGYVTITETTDRPAYNDAEGRIIYISGTQNAKDYKTILDGGKTYYLHMGYYKNATTNTGEDKFTINSLDISLSDLGLNHYEIETNSFGKAIGEIQYGKYKVTEIKSPNGYNVNKNIPDIEFRSYEGAQHEFTITNEPKAKVIVHYYLKDENGNYTETKLEDDEIIYGKINDEYTTIPKTEIGQYELEKDIMGEYVIPDNNTGLFTIDVIEVNYYYEKTKSSLIVYHLIEGTETGVPLSDGNNAKPRRFWGDEGDSYSTNSLSAEELSDKYELSISPNNREGTYGKEETVVTYYYKKKIKSLTINKKDLDNNNSIKGAKFGIYYAYDKIEDFDNLRNDSYVKDNSFIELQSRGRYCPWILDGEGKWIPSVCGNYLLENMYVPPEGTEYPNEPFAESYYVVDLRNETGNFDIVVNAETGINNDYYGNQLMGYVTTDLNNSSYYFMQIMGYSEVQNYRQTVTGGQLYYVVFKYTNYSQTYINDYARINSIAVVPQGENVPVNGDNLDEIDNIEQYGFEKTETGKLMSNNVGIDNLTARSVIPIDLIGIEGEYKLTINAEISSEENKDIGKIIISSRENFDSKYYIKDTETDKQIMAISGEESAKDYNVILEGNKLYNLYLEYVKDGENSEGADIFTINSIEIEGNLLNEITTNNEGIARVDLLTGRYLIKETLAPNGYEDSNESIEVEVGDEGKEITVTNEKNKGTVTVNHYVEGTTQPIELSDGSLAPTENKQGEIGSIYATKPHDGINKYTLVSADVPNASGEYIDGNIDVIYYYRLKPAEVIVNHFIMNPDGTKTEIPVPLRETGTVAQSEHIDGKVDDDYTTTSKTEYELDSNYELVETPTNAEGKMTVEPQEVNYYYGLKNTKVIVHHYQEPSETGGEVVKLAEDVEINGHVTDPYTTAQASSEELPRKFEFSRKTDNFEGVMTIEPIEVIYYYKTRDAVLNIKYQDYYTHEDIDTEEHQTGKVDDDYITTEKTIEGWTYQESTGNETGKLEVDSITVIFYYKKQTKVTVNYIDKLTNEALEPATTITGLEGDDYETVAKDFRWYVLTDPEPTNAEGQMTKDEIIVNYYYIRPETSLIEKHIDVTNNEILANETHEGRVGDEYSIPSRTFEGYDLVEERLPDNAEGRYTEEVIEVKYYYIKKARLIVKYVDKYTGEEIPNADGTPTGRDENKHEGDSYTTERKTFDGYVLEEVPTNADGTLEGGTTEVIYYYKQISGGVKENHIDKLTGLQLVNEVKHEGYVGEDYTTSPKEFSNYDLVQEEYPENATGKFRVEEQRVTYYYIQKSSVTIRYIDKETNKDIPNEDGTTSKEELTGHVGDSYTSEAKPFKGYILEQEPDNKEGTMTEEPITVIYYYRKIKFNLKVEKIIKTITVNGIEQEVNGDLAKAEVYRKEVANQSIQVKYVIRVTNDSEVGGRATLMETVPEGMIMNSSKNTGWSVNGAAATLETEEIIPGETKEYEVVLDWNKHGENIGTKTNSARIISVDNKYGIEETDTRDNEDTADLIIAVSTGDINYVYGALVLLIIGGIVVTFIKLDEKKKKAKLE